MELPQPLKPRGDLYQAPASEAGYRLLLATEEDRHHECAINCNRQLSGSDALRPHWLQPLTYRILCSAPAYAITPVARAVPVHQEQSSPKLLICRPSYPVFPPGLFGEAGSDDNSAVSSGSKIGGTGAHDMNAPRRKAPQIEPWIFRSILLESFANFSRIRFSMAAAVSLTSQ